MKKFLLATALVAMFATPVMAQSSNNYAGSPPWAFRSDNERLTRTNQALSTRAVANGQASGFAGSGGFGPSSTAISNYISVTNNVSCTGGDSVGSTITCTGGQNTVSGNSQTTTDSNVSANTSVTGNTISDKIVNNNTSGGN